MEPVEYSILQGLKEKIRSEMNNLADHISLGGAKDFPEYKGLCGQIEGLAMAERLLLDLLDLAVEADKDS